MIQSLGLAGHDPPPQAGFVFLASVVSFDVTQISLRMTMVIRHVSRVKLSRRAGKLPDYVG
jgi:hypothetical protein